MSLPLNSANILNDTGVQHCDLVKFGIDDTQTMEQSSMTTKINLTQAAKNPNAMDQLPNIISAFSESFIKIYRRQKLRSYYCKVDRDSGLIIPGEDDSYFNDINLFDTKSLPHKQEASIDNVSYWDMTNRYHK